MKEFRLSFRIPAEEMYRYYSGSATLVVATAYDGTRVQFPAMRLRPFFTMNGVQGEFLLRCDDQHKFVSLERLR